ncbi:unnamed protein product, partial [marine sediment metagenome]
RHLERLGEEEPLPGWLMLVEPDLKDNSGAAVMVGTEPADVATGPDDPPGQILDRALRAEGAKRAAAVRELWRLVRYDPDDQNPPRPGPGVTGKLLATLNEHPLVLSLAPQNQDLAGVRSCLVSFFKGRFAAILERESSGDDAVDLVEALPGILLAEVADGVLDDLDQQERAALLRRLLSMDFVPDSPESRRTVGLYTALFREAGSVARRSMIKRVFQAAMSEAPKIRATALEGLAGLMPELVGEVRKKAFRELLDALDGAEPQEVRDAARLSLSYLGRDLTGEE